MDIDEPAKDVTPWVLTAALLDAGASGLIAAVPTSVGAAIVANAMDATDVVSVAVGALGGMLAMGWSLHHSASRLHERINTAYVAGSRGRIPPL